MNGHSGMNSTLWTDPLLPQGGEDARWDPLQDWRERPHLPVWIIDEEPGAQIMLAMLKHVAAQFFYLGGSTPGQVRTVRPLEIFRVECEGPIYVRAWCETRQAERTFRMDRIRGRPVATRPLKLPGQTV